MKGKLTALSLLLFLSLLLTACSVQELPLIGDMLGGGSEVGPVHLTMWGMWENPEVMQALITRYQEQHPNVTIEYGDRSVIKPLVEYKLRVFNRINEEDGPDIVCVHAGWLPTLKGSLSPMPSSIMDVATYSASFYPVATQNAVLGGEIYGIPLYYDGLVLLYNKDHFAEVGQQGPPTVWEEFRRLALELTVRVGGGELLRAGAAMGNSKNIDHFSDILGLMWSQAGVTMPNDIDSSVAGDALEFYTNFIKEDGVWNETLPEATTAFANGQVSMIFVPSWRILDILSVSPNLNFGVAPVPQALADKPATWATFWMYTVASGSDNPKAAWEFLKFLSEEEQQLYMFNEASRYRAFGSPYSRVSLASELNLNEYLTPIISEASYAKTAEIASRAGNRKQVDALSAAVEAVLKGTSVENALATAKAAILGQ